MLTEQQGATWNASLTPPHTGNIFLPEISKERLSQRWKNLPPTRSHPRLRGRETATQTQRREPHFNKEALPRLRVERRGRAGCLKRGTRPLQPRQGWVPRKCQAAAPERPQGVGYSTLGHGSQQSRCERTELSEEGVRGGQAEQGCVTELFSSRASFARAPEVFITSGVSTARLLYSRHLAES